jgi:hypothetical protein
MRPTALAVFMLMAAAMAHDRKIDDQVIERLVKPLHAESNRRCWQRDRGCRERVIFMAISST